MVIAFKLINLNPNDWISIVIIAVLSILAITNFAFENRFRKLFSLPFSKSYFTLYEKDSPLIFNAFNNMLFVVNLLTFSLMIYFVLDAFNLNISGSSGFKLYWQILLSLAVFFSLKHFLLKMLNVLILNTREINKFTFYKLTFRSLTAVLIVMLLIVVVYSSLNKIVGAYLLLTVTTGFFAFGYVYSSKLVLDKNSNSLLHIILYLCALEIAPFLIYGKYVMNYFV